MRPTHSASLQRPYYDYSAGFMRNKAFHFGWKNLGFGVATLTGLTGAVYWLGYKKNEHQSAENMLTKSAEKQKH